MPASRKKRRARTTAAAKESPRPASTSLEIPAQLRAFLDNPATSRGEVASRKLTLVDLRKRLLDLDVRPTVPLDRLLPALRRIRPSAGPRMRAEVKESVRALKPTLRRFHGTKLELAWFPLPFVISPCADKFGYMSSPATRSATKLPFTPATELLLGELGELMGDPARDRQCPDRLRATATGGCPRR